MSIAVQAASPLDAANRRYTSRRALRLGAVLSDRGIEVVIHDLSLTGLLIETPQPLCSGETLFVDLPERGPTAASVVWSSGNFHGCAFELSIPAATVSAALLKSPVGAVPGSADGGLDIGRLQALTADLEAAEPVDDRYSLRTRGLVLGGLLVVSWGSIGWALTALL
jgi:hypothetical protein